MTAEQLGDRHKYTAVCEGFCPDCLVRMIPLRYAGGGAIAGLCRVCRTGWRAVTAGLEPGWDVRSFPSRSAR